MFKFSLLFSTYYYFLLLCMKASTIDNRHYSMITQIDNDYVYVGGRNYLARYNWSGHQLIFDKQKMYRWESGIMNGSDIGFNFTTQDQLTPEQNAEYNEAPQLVAFDTCLNWKQEHANASERNTVFDYQHKKYHTPSGDWLTMNFTCMNSFIRSVEPLDDDKLWVCGTFGAFPRAFSVNKTTLEFIKFVDVNVMSCARYVDEPMATFRDKSTNDLYVASGWGLYRPDKRNPDVPDNNSTMLYADWRLYRNLFTLPSAMAWVLSSDVNFINVVKETNDHLYFFGHEINNQYGLNNQEDRNAWQSFMLRICKRDLGYKYKLDEMQRILRVSIYPYHHKDKDGSSLSPNHFNGDYNKEWYDQTVHLPKTHFVNPLKINFGCFVGKRPRAISDNHFWGETNVVYINKLADVIFEPNRTIKFKSKIIKSYFGCNENNEHHQIPLMGVFNKEGLQGTSVKPTGALCQLQINQNIFTEFGSKRNFYDKHNGPGAADAHEELMALSSTVYSNFYSRTMNRINGYSIHPYWNQGVLTGDYLNYKYKKYFKDVGKCHNDEFYKTMSDTLFFQMQNISNIAWPNELPNRLSAIPLAVCQYSAAELYSFNATFVMAGVEFKKLFLVKDNITNYVMHEIKGEKVSRYPLMVVLIISTTGHLYRVVMCDFDNGILNHGEDKTANEWYNWCIFRHTDQPYLYRQYAPMERREWGESYQYRASSLLMEKKIVNKSDESSFPINRDPQFHIVKDVLRKGEYLHVLTAENIHSVNIAINCNTDYKTCIDCASDPYCMWSNKDNKCEQYNENRYKEPKFVQDVLDRGFKCASLIKTENKIVNFEKAFSETNSVILECPNAGLWRDKIEWRVNNIEINEDKEDYSLKTDKNHLVLLKDPKNITIISCHGIRTDYDKLFSNTEYDWIRNSGDHSQITLTVYMNDRRKLQGSGYSITLIVVIMLLVIALIGFVIIFILLVFFPRKWLSSSNAIRRMFGQRPIKGYSPVNTAELPPTSGDAIQK